MDHLDAADGSPANAVYVDNDGNVGIGTTSPTYKLDVVTTGNAISGHTTGYSIGVWGESPNIGVKGKSSGTGVQGQGGVWDFYAVGSGTNYGPFTGAHEVKLCVDFPESVQPGMIVSVTGEVQARLTEGEMSYSSTLPIVKLSDAPDDSKVLGVLVAETPLPEDHLVYR